jgi:hypothetical protein
VEDSLTPVKVRLRAGGYDVLNLAGGVPRDAQAVVVNGMDTDLLGRQDIVAAIPVINAEGRSAEDVATEVGRRIARFPRA